jgi:hypothetical protein
MNPIDLFIIYLACGAPFGVYCYFKDRSQNTAPALLLKTTLNFLFWIPSAFFFFHKNINLKSYFDRSNETLPADENYEKSISPIQKKIEAVLIKKNFEINIFESREVIGRYVGLTVAARRASTTSCEAEIFRLSPMGNSKLGSICLERRNQRRLHLHQTEARKDFIYLITRLLKCNLNDSEKYVTRQSAIELVKILNDIKAQNEIEKTLVDSPQTGNRTSVTKSEKDLCKPEIRKPSTTVQASIPFQPLSATISLRKKD